MSDGAGTLFVIATPIGNLEDITLRALRVLREVALVAAEDTRRTANLLRHYAIATPLISLHEHNERQRIGRLVARLGSGESIALVSDAGTPGISDPGALFVSAARAAGFRVEPVPGPSAVAAVLSASGVAFDRYAFAGFPPIRAKDRNSWLQWVRDLPDVPVVCFEAPHRLTRTLELLHSELGNRPIIVARELTKLHEEWIFLSNDQHVAVGALESPRGEFVLVVAPEREQPTKRLSTPSDHDIQQIFGQLTINGPAASRREAVRAAASRLGLSSKAVYEALERIKKATQT